MRLHEYSVFARFRYNDLKVGISSGNQALKRCAFPRTYPGTLSGLPVIWEQFGTIVSAVCVVPLCQLTGTNLTGLISCLR